MWDVVPMILSCYNAIMIPLYFSFGLDYEMQMFNLKFDFALDILFIVDNILMFFTSFENRQGQEVKDFYKIYLNYTRSWRFVFDSLSLLGLQLFTDINKFFKYFQLLKATRVIRIKRLITKLRQPKEIKSVFNIACLVFYLFLYLHMLACLFNLAVTYYGPTLYIVQDDRTYLN